MGVTTQGQVKPSLVPVPVPGIQRLAQNGRGMAEEYHIVIPVHLRGHALQVGPAVVHVVNTGQVDVFRADFQPVYAVDQRHNARIVHGLLQGFQVVFRGGAVMVAHHGGGEVAGMKGRGALEKRNGLLRGVGIIASQQNNIRVQAVDSRHQAAHPSLGKISALVDVADIDNFELPHVLRQVGGRQGNGLRLQQKRLQERISQHQQRQAAEDNKKEVKSGPGLVPSTIAHGQFLLPGTGRKFAGRA